MFFITFRRERSTCLPHGFLSHYLRINYYSTGTCLKVCRERNIIQQFISYFIFIISLYFIQIYIYISDAVLLDTVPLSSYLYRIYYHKNSSFYSFNFIIIIFSQLILYFILISVFIFFLFHYN